MIDVINLKKSFGSHDVLNGIDITINREISWLSSDQVVQEKVRFFDA